MTYVYVLTLTTYQREAVSVKRAAPNGVISINGADSKYGYRSVWRVSAAASA